MTHEELKTKIAPETALVESTDLLAGLSLGWGLVNRGTGWFLSEPTIAYRSTLSKRVPDELVRELESNGTIRIEVPYTSAKAFLANPEAEARRKSARLKHKGRYRRCLGRIVLNDY